MGHKSLNISIYLVGAESLLVYCLRNPAHLGCGVGPR